LPEEQELVDAGNAKPIPPGQFRKIEMDDWTGGLVAAAGEAGIVPRERPRATRSSAAIPIPRTSRDIPFFPIALPRTLFLLGGFSGSVVRLFIVFHQPHQDDDVTVVVVVAVVVVVVVSVIQV